MRQKIITGMALWMIVSIFTQGLVHAKAPWFSTLNIANENFAGVAYGNKIYTAVTDTGNFFVSDDSLDWKLTESFQERYISHLAFLNGTFFAIGSNILLSMNGLSWQDVAFTGSPLYGITYGNGLYVAVGHSGKIFSSKNALDWDWVKVDANITLRAISYGDDRFVAVGDSGIILSSVDGIQWKNHSIPEGPTFTAVHYAQGSFIVCGVLGNIYQSPDGTQWQKRSSGDTALLNSISYIRDRYYAAGGSATGFGPGVILSSATGETWDKTLVSHTIQHLGYANNQFLAAGNQGFLASSKDGKTWSNFKKQTVSSALYDIAYVQGSFYSVSKSGELLFSKNALDWERKQVAASPLYALSYAHNALLIGAERGLVLRSEDFASFAPIQTPGNENIYKFFTANDHIFALTPSETLVTKNGIAWETLPYESAGVFFVNGQYQLLGSNFYLTAPDAKSWVKTSLTLDHLVDSAYGNGRYVAFAEGRESGLYVSSDLNSWKKTFSTSEIKNILFLNQQFFAITGAGDILSSPNGETWNSENINSLAYAIAYGNQRYVTAGDKGEILIQKINANRINIYVNQEEVISDIDPVNKNGRVMIPARVIFEHFGASVAWDAARQEVQISKDNVRLRFSVNSKVAQINDKTVTLDATPFIQEGRTLVPLRFIAEALGASVAYDAKNQAVLVTTP